ncbi:AMP-binding protein [Paenibacillus sp. N1-5-1-14]|uniref:AMP-binding protein n=1 Tax=Paenibacillus radicibacter TaxID=2972488 RepID=UPI00215957CD|nr:AMP-binding protein [Paenibacillus radicibacter]MCR8642365.1 AMP-binding protein [Paenibacillus radicibacter]
MNVEKPWLRHYPAEVSPTYDYPKRNVAQFLIQTAEKSPQLDAIYFMGKKMKYNQLLDKCYRFANGLLELGIKKGDRVAIMLPNCPQAVIAFYGSLLIGAIVVQTNPMYTERELEHQMVDAGAKVIVTLDLLYRKVMKIRHTTDIERVIVTSIKDYLPFPLNLLYPIKAKKDGLDLTVQYSDVVSSFKKHIASASNSPVHVELDAENDLALLQYTGGTTGLSKGVQLTHYNIVSNTMQLMKWVYRVREGKEVFLGALPIFHVFGMTVMMNQAIFLGGMMVLLPKFDPESVLKAITKQKVTIFPGAPTMYIALINHPKVKEYDLSSVQICVSGAAGLPNEVQERFEQISGGCLIEGYGLTEASPVTHANPVWDYRKSGTIGIPMPDTIAKVVDPQTGDELPIGEIGELIITGPQIMKGYWNREEETRNTLRDGWLYTGDMAKMDEEGFFSIVDRKKDLIIAGGFNIYPREVEEVLYEHPKIKEAVAVGVPDEYRGETVKAFIVLKEGETVTQEELNIWCRERLAAFKVPRKFEFREALPMTMVGKVLRRKLLEEEEKAV